MSELSAIRSGLRTIDVSSKVAVVRPHLATGVTIPASSAFSIAAVGAWGQVTSSGDLASHALVAVRVIAAGTVTQAQIQVGTGAAGSETPIALVPYLNGGTATDTIPVFPAAFLPANERVAVRYTANTTGAVMVVKLEFMPRPY